PCEHASWREQGALGRAARARHHLPRRHVSMDDRQLGFDAMDPPGRAFPFAPGAVLLRGFALDCEADLLAGLDAIAAASPFRHMITPGGFRMSVAMTSCGELGWISD